MQRWPYDTGYQDISKNKKNKKQIDYERIMKFMRELIGRKIEGKKKERKVVIRRIERKCLWKK